MSAKKKECDICHQMVDTRGMNGHKRIIHHIGIAGSSAAALAALSAKVASQDAALAAKDAEIARLSTAPLAETSYKSLADFIANYPGDIGSELSTHFTAFLKNLDPETRAQLAEETGFGSPAPAVKLEEPEAAPPAAEPAPSPSGGEMKASKVKVVVTYDGRPVGTLTTREAPNE
mgnify:CR=1 FL=1